MAGQTSGVGKPLPHHGKIIVVEVIGDSPEGTDMKLFGQIIRTVVNTTLLPVAVVKDVYTLGGVATEQDKSYTRQQLEKLAEDAQED